MPRELVLEKPLMIKLDRALKERLKAAAAEHDTDMSKIAREAIARHLDALERQRREPGRVADWIEQMSGTATVKMTTDEIMALTRGE